MGEGGGRREELVARWRFASPGSGGVLAEVRRPYTLHPTPYTLQLTPYTLHPTPYTLHPTPCSLHPTPHILHPTANTVHPSSNILHPTPCTLHPTFNAPYTLNPTLYTHHSGIDCLLSASSTPVTRCPPCSLAMVASGDAPRISRPRADAASEQRGNSSKHFEHTVT